MAIWQTRESSLCAVFDEPLSWEVSGGLDEVEEIGDRLEWIVDLVGDGAGEATYGGEFFALDESRFGFFLVGDLLDDGGDGLDRAVGAPRWASS